MKKISVVLAFALMLCAVTVSFAADRDWSIFRLINPDAFGNEETNDEVTAFLDTIDEDALCASASAVIVTDTWASSYELGLEIEETKKAALGSYAMFYKLGDELYSAFYKVAADPMAAAGDLFFSAFSEYSVEMAYTSTFTEDQDEASLASSYRMVGSFFSDGECSFEKPEANHYIGTMDSHWYDDSWNSHPAVMTQDCTYDPDSRVMTYTQIIHVTDLDLDETYHYSVTDLGDDTYEIETDADRITAVYKDGTIGDFTYYKSDDGFATYKYEIRRSGDELKIYVDGKEVQ